MKQLGLAGLMYATDYDDTAPIASVIDTSVSPNVQYPWVWMLLPYTKNDQIYICPAQSPVTQWDNGGRTWPAGCPRNVSYTINGIATGGHWGSLSGSNRGYYSYTGQYGMFKQNDIMDPAVTIWFFEGDSTSWAMPLYIYTPLSADIAPPPGNSGTPAPRPSKRHNEGFNATYADGHSKWSKFGATQWRNWCTVWYG